MLHWIPLLCVLTAVAAADTVDTGYTQMYNLEFQAAHRSFQEWERLNPADPFGPASDAAAYLFSELDRLHILQSEFFADDNKFLRMTHAAPDAQVKKQFEASLQRATSLAESKLKKQPGDVDAQFALVLVHGLRSDYLGLVERSYLASLNELKLGREAADRLLAAKPDFYDAYLAIGVENYMLSLKPAPLRWMLRLGGAETDRRMGIEKLKLTAQGGRYLKPFARLLLAVAALRDKDYPRAKELLGWLSREYPHNPLYREELSKVK
jgi:hypothetical protein